MRGILFHDYFISFSLLNQLFIKLYTIVHNFDFCHQNYYLIKYLLIIQFGSRQLFKNFDYYLQNDYFIK